MFYAPVSGFTPLHRAAQRGDEDEVATLLADGADVSAKDSEGRTALHHAVMRGHVGVVDQLLDKAGPALLLAKDILNCTPVHLAAVQNQVTLIIRLVDALLEDVNGKTPLHEVARRRCMQDFMGFLHLGWESATLEDDGSGGSLASLSPLWSAVAAVVDLSRPGLPTVQRVLGWHPLHVAAMSGNIELIQRLVEQFHCDLRVKSMNSWTPLHYAAAYNQVAAIEALCALGCEVAVQDAVGSTPMHVAAGEGHLEAIQALVQLGCSPQVTDRDGCTPLYCAAAWNRIEAVRLLEKLQCPSSLRSLEGRTPIHVAAEQGWVDLIDVLVREFGNSVDSRDNYQFTPLHSAANGGHVEAVRRLADLSHDLNAKDYLGRTPLHYAAMHGRAAAIDELVRLGAGLEEQDSRGGYTALHLAADAGQCEAISRLVALGAPVDGSSTKGLAPLALALMKGPANVDAVALLVELGASVEAVLEARNLETPLHVAARAGRADIIERLVLCPGISVSSRTKDGSTPLHYAAAFGQTHVLEPLVAAGCPVDARDNALNTPMHLAAGCGFLDTVVKLVELGADINARDITDCTPLQNAAHGTYSALAAMPANGAGALGPSSSAQTGYARLNPPHQPQLTPAQQAAQAALSAGSNVKRDGLVPVRTGLAWSQSYSHPDSAGAGLPPMLSGVGGSSAAASFTATLDIVPAPVPGIDAMGALAANGGGSGPLAMPGPPGPSGSNLTQDLWSTWKSLGLTQLLKKAYKQQQKRQDRPAGQSAAAAATQLQQTQQTVQAALQQMQAALQQSQAALQQQLLLQLQQGQAAGAGPVTSPLANPLLPGPDGRPPAAPAGGDNLDALLRRSEQLHLATGEQDRSRLIKVVQKLVDLGADLHAVDNEGRTALHLAAGCGDRSMAVKLVDLGTDINCRDSVGGTAMHHAAMANKKDMMFSLARLGCDWRARADGIDGATASFVLCGQHGKTTRQQKLLDAKLKRVFQEGTAARLAGHNPLALLADDEGGDDAALDLEAERELADAAMAALLEEVEHEGEAESAKKKKAGKKKKGKGAKAEAGGETVGEGSGEGPAEAQVSPLPAVQVQELAAAPAGPTPGSDSKQGRKGKQAAKPQGAPLESPRPEQAAPSPQRFREETASPAPVLLPERFDEVSSAEASLHDAMRIALDTTTETASKLLSEQLEPEEDELEIAVQALDDAIDKAAAVGVSVKYGKKIRKKLQTALDRARGILPPEPATTPQPAVPEQQQMSQPVAQQEGGGHAVRYTPLGVRSSGLSAPPPPPPAGAARAPPPGFLAGAAATARPSGLAKPPGFAQGMQPAMLPPQSAQQQRATTWAPPPPPPPPPMPPAASAGAAAMAPPPPAAPLLPAASHSQLQAPLQASHLSAAGLPEQLAQAMRLQALGYVPSGTASLFPGQEGMVQSAAGQQGALLFGNSTQQQQQQQQQSASIASPGHSLFTPRGSFEASPGAAPAPPTTSSPLFGGASLFSHAGMTPQQAQQAFAPLGSYDSASLSGHFTDLDMAAAVAVAGQHGGFAASFAGLQGGPGPAAAQPTGGSLDAFIGHDLAAQVFGGAGQGLQHGDAAAAARAAAGLGNGLQGPHDPGASLLSADLLGEIDGTVNSSMMLQQQEQEQQYQQQQQYQASTAPPADPALSLPADDASLFSPPTASLVGLPGVQGSGFHAMW